MIALVTVFAAFLVQITSFLFMGAVFNRVNARNGIKQRGV
jgi:hypothetical protein